MQFNPAFFPHDKVMVALNDELFQHLKQHSSNNNVEYFDPKETTLRALGASGLIKLHIILPNDPLPDGTGLEPYTYILRRADTAGQGHLTQEPEIYMWDGENITDPMPLEDLPAVVFPKPCFDESQLPSTVSYDETTGGYSSGQWVTSHDDNQYQMSIENNNHVSPYTDDATDYATSWMGPFNKEQWKELFRLKVCEIAQAIADWTGGGLTTNPNLLCQAVMRCVSDNIGVEMSNGKVMLTMAGQIVAEDDIEVGVSVNDGTVIVNVVGAEDEAEIPFDVLVADGKVQVTIAGATKEDDIPVTASIDEDTGELVIDVAGNEARVELPTSSNGAFASQLLSTQTTDGKTSMSFTPVPGKNCFEFWRLFPDNQVRHFYVELRKDGAIVPGYNIYQALSNPINASLHQGDSTGTPLETHPVVGNNNSGNYATGLTGSYCICVDTEIKTVSACGASTLQNGAASWTTGLLQNTSGGMSPVTRYWGLSGFYSNSGAIVEIDEIIFHWGDGTPFRDGGFIEHHGVVGVGT